MTKIKNNTKKIQIGIIGSAGNDDYENGTGADKKMMLEAEKLGKLLAENNAVVVTGGKSGIMEAAARGAKKAFGTTIGVISGGERFTSNNFTDIEILSGMTVEGFDEFLLVNMCDGFIIVGGGAGTLGEISIAYRNSKPLVALANTGGWAEKLAGTYLDSRKRVKIRKADNTNEAIKKLFEEINKKNN